MRTGNVEKTSSRACEVLRPPVRCFNDGFDSVINFAEKETLRGVAAFSVPVSLVLDILSGLLKKMRWLTHRFDRWS
jgi:hypothetical protein